MRDVFQGISGVLDRTTKFLINKFSSIFLTVLVLPLLAMLYNMLFQKIFLADGKCC